MPNELFQDIVEDYLVHNKEYGMQNPSSPTHNYYIEYKAIEDLKKNRHHTSNPNEASSFIIPTPCVFLLVQNKDTTKIMQKIKNFIKSKDTWAPYNHWMIDIWNRCYKHVGVNLMAFEIKTDIRGSLQKFKKDPWGNSRHIVIPYPVVRMNLNNTIIPFMNRTINSTIYMSFDTNNPKVNMDRKKLADDLQNWGDNKVVIIKRNSKLRVSIKDIHRDMCNSKYCPIVEGDSISSKRLFNAIQCNCLPVILSKWMMLPFESTIPYKNIFDVTLNPRERFDLLNKHRGKLMYDIEAYDSIVNEMFMRINILPTYWLSFRRWD